MALVERAECLSGGSFCTDINDFTTFPFIEQKDFLQGTICIPTNGRRMLIIETIEKKGYDIEFDIRDEKNKIIYMGYLSGSPINIISKKIDVKYDISNTSFITIGISCTVNYFDSVTEKTYGKIKGLKMI